MGLVRGGCLVAALLLAAGFMLGAEGQANSGAHLERTIAGARNRSVSRQRRYSGAGSSAAWVATASSRWYRGGEGARESTPLLRKDAWVRTRTASQNSSLRETGRDRAPIADDRKWFAARQLSARYRGRQT